jgi:hypothetical protein
MNNSSENAALEDEPLGWRMDPVLSFSDWSVEIRPGSNLYEWNNNNSNEIGAPVVDYPLVYHIHKCVAGIGPRKSDYFQHLFRNENFSESARRSSVIELDIAEASLFSSLLDYIYATPQLSEFNISTRTAVPLYNLAEYFGVRALRQLVLDVVAKDLHEWGRYKATRDESNSIPVCYYKMAELSHCEAITNCVVQYAAKMAEMDFFFGMSHLMEICDLQFWLAVTRTVQNEMASDATIIPQLILSMASLTCALLKRFVGNGTTVVEYELFCELTNETVLPCMRHNAAIDLLELEQHYNPTIATGSAGGLTSLQARCVRALARQESGSKSGQMFWKNNSAELARLKKLPAHVLIEIIRQLPDPAPTTATPTPTPTPLTLLDAVGDI